MKTKEIEKVLKEAGIEQNEAKIEAKMFVRHFMKLSDVNLAIKEDFEPNEELLIAVQRRIERREPIQHIIGTAYFMGEDYFVNSNVLIPRDETEILVTKAIELINENGFKSILDIGTGSGCIACSIAKNTEAKVLGVDISKKALEVANSNAERLNLSGKVLFKESDVFSSLQEGGKFDLIVSNPPYIPPTERGNLQKEVEFDPEIALFAFDDSGVFFYEKITENAPFYLNQRGFLMFELGINQAKKVCELMEKSGFGSIGVIKDFAGIERVIFGRLIF